MAVPRADYAILRLDFIRHFGNRLHSIGTKEADVLVRDDTIENTHGFQTETRLRSGVSSRTLDIQTSDYSSVFQAVTLAISSSKRINDCRESDLHRGG